VLEYSELIVIAALVGYRANSVVGFLHMWTIQTQWLVVRNLGPPKEMAEFTWRRKRVTVRQGNRLLCSFNYNRQGFWVATVVRRVWFQY